ncbi:division plane positioning ATPase MipZ [Parerythrobacter aestuarii]|uniref:division plane positioning ATPase MipZ n=1 Tax=Parerythrobacter aestuarii TaxID=3020909 RepID=UPI0024DE0C2B|nr:division plane positioning ATPase MipZ [Parerythrobacter aestuarii]
MLNDNDQPPQSRDGIATDEHPRVVVADIAARFRLPGHVITFANEKGGVGKSTLAFHTAVALASLGQRVVAIDLDRRQRTLHRGLQYRHGTASSVGVHLPMPVGAVLDRPSAAQLWQEVLRLDAAADFIVIDAAGADSPIFRRAVALADTLVTPVNSSFLDLELLGRHNPVTREISQTGCFASLVTELRAERIEAGFAPTDWIVFKNRVRHAEKRQGERIAEALQALSRELDFRIGQGLSERVAFRELFPFGLTHLDLKHLPGMSQMEAHTAREIDRMMADLALSFSEEAAPRLAQPPKARRLNRSVAAFSEALAAYR